MNSVNISRIIILGLVPVRIGRNLDKFAVRYKEDHMNQIIREWTGAAAAALLTIALLAMAAVSTQAQEPDTSKQKDDVQALKEQVKQLQKMVEDLNKKIGTVEEAQKQTGPTALATTSDAADRPITPAPKAPIAKTDAEKTTLDIYGFAMLDAGYDFKTNHPDWFDTLRPTKLPSFGGEFAPNGKTYWGVRQSRLGFKTSTPTALGELKTIFEFELFGTGVDAGQTTFRLRHAYGELGQFGAGQYWTVFGDTDAFPNTFEYWGPNGLVWFRNVQVRWMPMKGRNELTIGLERPGASGDQGIYADRVELSGIKTHLQLPDLTGNFRLNRDWGHVQFSGILRRIAWKDTNTTDNVDLSGSATGVGGSISSALNFGKNDVGRFQATYGQGIQNYFNDAPVDVGIKVTPVVNPLAGTPSTSVKGIALPIFGMSAFLDHRWNERFTTAVGYSMVNISNSNGQAPNAFRRGQYGIANLAYNPVPKVTIAGEFQWGRRDNFTDHFHSNDSRIQFAFKYNFAKTIAL